MTRNEAPSPEARQAALNLLHEDVLLNDSVFTPPGALGHYLERGDGSEGAADREPRNPLIPSAAGAIALVEIDDTD